MQLILAADPKEHQHSVGGKEGRYLFVTNMLKSTMTQQLVDQMMMTAIQKGMTSSASWNDGMTCTEQSRRQKVERALKKEENEEKKEEEKEEKKEEEWDEELNDAEGRSQTNAARTGTKPAVPDDAVDNDTGAGGANNPGDETCNEAAVFEQWYGMRGK